MQKFKHRKLYLQININNIYCHHTQTHHIHTQFFSHRLSNFTSSEWRIILTSFIVSQVRPSWYFFILPILACEHGGPADEQLTARNKSGLSARLTLGLLASKILGVWRSGGENSSPPIPLSPIAYPLAPVLRLDLTIQQCHAYCQYSLPRYKHWRRGTVFYLLRCVSWVINNTIVMRFTVWRIHDVIRKKVSSIFFLEI